MKSSLLILPLVIAGLGGAAAATEFETSSQLANYDKAARGLVVTVGLGPYSQSSTTEGKIIWREQLVQLDSFTLTSSDGSLGYAGDVYMLVFETKYDQDGNPDFTASGNGDLLGSSKLLNWSNTESKEQTFEFDSGFFLNPHTNYSFVFSASNTGFEELPGESDEDKSLRIKLGDIQFALAHKQGNYMNAMGYDPMAIAKMTIKTSSVESVPEPSTATLGILGLASLMLRRRRK